MACVVGDGQWQQPRAASCGRGSTYAESSTRSREAARASRCSGLHTRGAPPTTGANAIANYFPGRSQVDLVGADGYNFGDRGGLTWTDPGTIFSPAYKQIEALADKPFWIAETGSTADGGDKAGWILSLSTLQSTSMPKLAGLVWYDVDDPLGDFRLRGRTVMSAFRDLVEEGCR